MLRLLADENFNHKIVRGLIRRRSKLDIVSVRDVGLRGGTDEDVLAWAAGNDRIVLTHDRATMPSRSSERVTAGALMPGVFVISNRLAIRLVIDEILLVDDCSDQSEWANLVVHIPL